MGNHSNQARRVSFVPDDVLSTDAQSGHSRDSGFSSMEYVPAGGRPYSGLGEQWRSLPALQEALTAANKKTSEQRKKIADTEELLYGARQQIHDLESLNTALQEQVNAFKADLDDMRDENMDLRQRMLSLEGSATDEMSGGSGDSGNGIRRSRSQRKSDEKFKDRMKERINRDSRPPTSSTSTVKASRGKSRSRAPAERKPYLEEQPGDRVRGHRSRHTEYTTAAPMAPSYSRLDGPSFSAVPRSPTSTLAHAGGYNDVPISGDYVPYPLPHRPRQSDLERRGR